MKIVTIVGARPQFVKAAIVSREFALRPDIDELVVHTGQHYDERMSQVFFDDLGIPEPTYNLKVGSGSHGQQTGRMLEGIESILMDERPDAVLVYGDTNSTLAGALSAAKLHLPLAHVESGLRSFNRLMPEEINRVTTDHVSQLLLCPTDVAVTNLANEGIVDGVHLVGDVMYDAALTFGRIADRVVDPLAELRLSSRHYVLMTCHRAENTDDPARMSQILAAARRIADEVPVVYPVHPRLKEVVRRADLPDSVLTVEPLTYFEMLAMEKQARLILTDSGGVQKEAFFFGVPCVTMRDETEWKETIKAGANSLAGANEHRIVSLVKQQLASPPALPSAGSHYGNGFAATQVAELVGAMGEHAIIRVRAA